jgi:hypothetical protein
VFYQIHPKTLFSPRLTNAFFLILGLNRRREDSDAHNILYIFSRFWDQVNINRIPEADMQDFVAAHRAAAAPWHSLCKKYQ